VQNHPGVPAWRDAIRAGTPGTARGIALTADDRLRRSVIEEIMCRGDADLAAIAERHGRDPDALMDAAPALRQLMADGLITWTGHHVAITERGRPYLRHLAAAFDARLATGAGRHSAAV
jgi:oxygen-independent coproporphyrinogen-3 oxidase